MWQVYALIVSAGTTLLGLALLVFGWVPLVLGQVVLGVGLSMLAVVAVQLLRQSIVVVGGQEVGLVERRYFGRPLPQGRVVAVTGETGIRATTLEPGLHILNPFLYSAEIQPMTVIEEDEVGLVESIDGQPVPAGDVFARRAEGHDHFQDGEGFLLSGGQKGPQVDVLPPGKYRINPYLFRLKTVPLVVVPLGHVGVVTARDGDPLRDGRLLGRSVPNHAAFQDGASFLANGGQRGPQIDVILPGSYRINTDLFSVSVQPAITVPANKVGLVTANDGRPMPEHELVAPAINNHNDFQNGSAFLDNGGHRGPQFDVLKPGTYYINPLMFSVTMDDVEVVQRGEVAVLVSNVGKEPRPAADERLGDGRERYVVPAGYRGIQADVTGPGVYYLNRWAYLPYIIPTTNLTIDWAEEPATEVTPSTPGHRVQVFDPLTVISRDGFQMRVSVKVIIRVRPEQAPLMVAKIGSLQNLTDNVIHPMIDSSFRNQASSTEAMNFMQDRAVEQVKAEERARIELERYHVECVSVLISQITIPQELMEVQTKRVIAAQQQAMYQEQQRAEQERIATENTRAQANKQLDLVSAQVGVQIAEQTRNSTIIQAEGRARSVELEGDAEGKRIQAIGAATAEAYAAQVSAIGQGNVAGIEIMKSVAGANLKITPDIILGSGDGSENTVFAAYIAQLLSTSRTNATATNGNEAQ